MHNWQNLVLNISFVCVCMCMRARVCVCVCTCVCTGIGMGVCPQNWNELTPKNHHIQNCLGWKRYCWQFSHPDLIHQTCTHKLWYTAFSVYLGNTCHGMSWHLRASLSKVHKLIQPTVSQLYHHSPFGTVTYLHLLKKKKKTNLAF